MSASLEKRVWTYTRGSNLYPNLYLVLVGAPGVGKSAILAPSEKLLRTVGDLHVAPSSLTTASLIDTLNLSAHSSIDPKGILISFNSLQVISSELGVFLPAYDSAFMNTLTKLYDGELYEERRRTGKVNHIRIESPQLSILGGTTPAYLNTFLPDGAWDQGFTSRCIFVYSGEMTDEDDPFPGEDEKLYAEQVFTDLVHDLKLISKMHGRLFFATDAEGAAREWYRDGRKPVPEHGKLVHYNSRRFAHCMKLCQVASVARGEDYIISKEDFDLALAWLLEAEVYMPDIFKSMGISGDARAIQDAWYVIWDRYSKTKQPVGEYVLVDFLKDRVPSHNIAKIIEVMVRSHSIKPAPIINGVPYYLPGPKSTKL